MDRWVKMLVGVVDRIPYMRGDGPTVRETKIGDSLYSLHAWGWTVRK